MAVIKETTWFGNHTSEPRKVKINKVKGLNPEKGIDRSFAMVTDNLVQLFYVDKTEVDKTAIGNVNTGDNSTLLAEHEINDADLRKTSFGGRVETAYTYVPDTVEDQLNYANRSADRTAKSAGYYKVIRLGGHLLVERGLDSYVGRQNKAAKEKVSKVINKVLFRGK